MADAVSRATAAVRWEHANEPFWDGEVEPCINSATVSSGVYFGHDVSGIVNRLLTEQMADWIGTIQYEVPARIHPRLARRVVE